MSVRKYLVIIAALGAAGAVLSGNVEDAQRFLELGSQIAENWPGGSGFLNTL